MLKENQEVAAEKANQNEQVSKIFFEEKSLNNSVEINNEELKENLLRSEKKIGHKDSDLSNQISEAVDFIKFRSSGISHIENNSAESVFDVIIEGKFIYLINKFFFSDEKRKQTGQDTPKKNFRNRPDTLNEYEKESNSLRNHFLSLYKEKMKIVDDFYNEKLKEISEDFENLKNKMIFKRQTFINSSFIANDMTLRKSMQQSIKKENAERDELGFAVSWKRAISHLYNTCSWLNSYMSINSIANQKITKKLERVFKECDIVSAKDEVQQITDFVNFSLKNEQVAKISKNIKDFYAVELTSGNKNLAQKELDDRMKGTRIKDVITIAFYSGMIISLLFAMLLLWYISSN